MTQNNTLPIRENMMHQTSSGLTPISSTMTTQKPPGFPRKYKKILRQAKPIYRYNKIYQQLHFEFIDDIKSPTIADRWIYLSPQERKFLMLFSDGLMMKTIAFHMNISKRTVEIHRSSSWKKLGVQSHQATYAIKELVKAGLIE